MKIESGRVCGQAGTGECCRQTYNGQSDTGGGVLGRGHGGSWASCAEREPGNSECWMLQSCSERTHLKKAEKISEAVKEHLR